MHTPQNTPPAKEDQSIVQEIILLSYKKGTMQVRNTQGKSAPSRGLQTIAPAYWALK